MRAGEWRAQPPGVLRNSPGRAPNPDPGGIEAVTPKPSEPQSPKPLSLRTPETSEPKCLHSKPGIPLIPAVLNRDYSTPPPPYCSYEGLLV